MNRLAWGLVWLLGLELVACGDDGGDPEGAAPDASAKPSQPSPDKSSGGFAALPPLDVVARGGQTGSGASPGPCMSDAQCEEQAQEWAERFTTPRPMTPLLRSDCVSPLDLS